MRTNFLPFLLALAPLFLPACSSTDRKAASPPAVMDSLGVFVDACKVLSDSVTLEADSLRIHARGRPQVHGLFARARGEGRDTLFFAGGAMAFLRLRDFGASPQYFFGYSHRGGRDDWDGAMWVEVVPRRLVKPGIAYARGNRGNFFLCSEAQGSGASAPGAVPGKPSEDDDP